MPETHIPASQTEVSLQGLALPHLFLVTMSESIVLNSLAWPVLQRQDPSFQMGTVCLDFQIDSEDTILIPSPLALPPPFSADTALTLLWLFL